jgi:RNA polymerase sigma-70 factor (ECF subfamily)
MFLRQKKKETEKHSMALLSDEALVSQYLESGNKEFVAELFERYTHLVFGICLNYLHDPEQSKDAVMDIFESLFHKLAVHNIFNFRNWLYSVTRNHCLMAIRKSGIHARAKGVLLEEAMHGEPDALTADEELLLSQGLLVAAVDSLNHAQGTCIRLLYIDNRSYRDIADITGYSVNEVKSHIQNGKRNLKNYIMKHDEDTKDQWIV